MAFTLHVRCVEATDIPRMDSNATDAYCVLSTSSEQLKTNVIQNSMHPRWNQDFHFQVIAPQQGSLHILMRDKDAFKDDDMGTLEIPFASLPIGQVLDQWYDIIPAKKVKKGGRLHLVLHMAPTGAQPFAAVPMYPQQGYNYFPPGCPQIMVDPRIPQLEQTNAALVNENQQLKNQLAAQNAELDRLRKKNAKMNDQIRHFQTFVANTKKSMDSLNLRIED